MHNATDVPLSEFGHQGMIKVPGLMREELHEALQSRIPERSDNQVFPKRELITFLAWWRSPRGHQEPLYIHGPWGCGKSSFVRQVAARLNYPVVEVVGREDLLKDDLVGTFVLKGADGMQWVDGPATFAWRHGALLLINEFTSASPSFWVANNDILEGAPIHIERTGEVVHRHPQTRIVITDNTKGLVADMTGATRGRMVQDASVMDRVWKMGMDYMSEEDEIRLLKDGMPQIGTDPQISDALQTKLAEKLRRIADDVRKAYVGGTDDNQTIEATLSTRSLLRFRDLLFMFKDGKRLGFRPIHDALDVALTGMCDEMTRAVIHKFAELHFGSDPAFTGGGGS